MKAPIPAQKETFGYLLRGIYDMLQRRVYEGVRLAGYDDVREAHSNILRNLAVEGGRMTELARTIGMTKQSVAYLVEDLCALGYLALSNDPVDRRAKIVSYTERGRQLLDTLVEQSRLAEQACERQVGAERMRALRATLDEILAGG